MAMTLRSTHTHRILVKVKKAAEKSAGGILLAPTMGKQRCVFCFGFLV